MALLREGANRRRIGASGGGGRVKIRGIAGDISNPTALLLAWGQGDKTAFDRLVPLVHAEVRRLAHPYMAGERRRHTLQTSALVNEACLRLIDVNQVRWQNRSHFFAMAATTMRRMLVDDALTRLRGVHPRPPRVVELRFFGGLTLEEAATALDVSVDTVKRDWRFAKLWLLRDLDGTDGR